LFPVWLDWGPLAAGRSKNDPASSARFLMRLKNEELRR
jgi:hypothetical protein